MSDASCIQHLIFLASYHIVPWGSITSGSCLPPPCCYLRRGGNALIEKAPQSSNSYMCVILFFTDPADKMLHKDRSCSKSEVGLLWAKHKLSVVTLIKKLSWGLKGLLCLQNINALLLLPLCMVGKGSSRFILIKIPLLSFSPDTNCTLEICSLSNPLRMAALFLLVSRHLSTSICLAKTIRYLCHVN